MLFSQLIKSDKKDKSSSAASQTDGCFKAICSLWQDKKEIPPKRKDFLKKAIKDCCQALDDAYHGLQLASEPDLIDRYIYELNAANMRYRVLLRDLREALATEAEAAPSPAGRLEAVRPTPVYSSAKQPAPAPALLSSAKQPAQASPLFSSAKQPAPIPTPLSTSKQPASTPKTEKKQPAPRPKPLTAAYSSSNISSTNLDTDTSLLNRSLR